VIPVSILLDDLEITKHVYLTLDKIIGFAADEFEFEIENSGEKYTDRFYDTFGEKLGIQFGGAITFAGQMDTADYNPLNPQVLTVRGRDHTGKLCDSLLDQAQIDRFTGKTDSQIVKLIGDSVSFPTDLSATPRVWSEQSLFAPGASLWIAVVGLAKRNGFDAWVGPDKTIHFRKRELSTSPKRSYDAKRLAGVTVGTGEAARPCKWNFIQDKLLSRGLKVMVIGYDPKTKKGHKVTSKLLPEAPEAGAGTPSLLPSLPGRDTQQGRRPGEISYTAAPSQRNSANYQIITVVDYSLDTKEKCMNRAEALLREYSAGLITGSLFVPGDAELEVNDCIQITGCRIAERTGGKYYVVGLRHEHSAVRFATTIQFASKVLTENLLTTEADL